MYDDYDYDYDFDRKYDDYDDLDAQDETDTITIKIFFNGKNKFDDFVDLNAYLQKSEDTVYGGTENVGDIIMATNDKDYINFQKIVDCLYNWVDNLGIIEESDVDIEDVAGSSSDELYLYNNLTISYDSDYTRNKIIDSIENALEEMLEAADVKYISIEVE